MWSVEAVTPSWQALPPNNAVGHRFTVSLALRYTPSDVQAPLAESPPLVWNERITQIEHHALEYWTWEGDLYGLRPGARTFQAWRRRYIEAYNSAAMSPTLRIALSGAVQLLDATGGPIRIGPALGQALPQSDEDKALYIRRLMQRTECVLRVEIDDAPALADNPPTHPLERLGRKRERLLLFDCGVDAHRILASQHLVVDQHTGIHNVSQFNQDWSPPALYTTGLTNIPCPSPIYRFVPYELSDPQVGEYA